VRLDGGEVKLAGGEVRLVGGDSLDEAREKGKGRGGRGDSAGGKGASRGDARRGSERDWAEAGKKGSRECGSGREANWSSSGMVDVEE
jgi:hypothetical protein